MCAFGNTGMLPVWLSTKHCIADWLTGVTDFGSLDGNANTLREFESTRQAMPTAVSLICYLDALSVGMTCTNSPRTSSADGGSTQRRKARLSGAHSPWRAFASHCPHSEFCAKRIFCCKAVLNTGVPRTVSS